MDAGKSSPLSMFKSKKQLHSPASSDTEPRKVAEPAQNPWSVKTPGKPLDAPRRLRHRGAVMSIKEVREAAMKLRERGSDTPARTDPLLGSEKEDIVRSKKKSVEAEIQLPEKRFTYGHLAQLKFILPEAILVEKVLRHDERTSCMKPDLHITLNVEAIESKSKSKSHSRNLHLRKIFHGRLLDFFTSHPEVDEVPEEELPEPFTRLKASASTSSLQPAASSLMSETSAGAVLEGRIVPASHLSASFKRSFLQRGSGHLTANIKEDQLEEGKSSDDDIFDILPEALLQSIREKERLASMEKDPAISQAKRRQQMIASLPKLFDMMYFLFQSIRRSIITKEELIQKIITGHLDIVDRREVEEQLRLLQELAPEWIHEKLASSGDILLCVNKISSPEVIRTKLSEAK
ncbi:CDT1-like protein a, chloroplastic [Sesamum angolense]|uniref:CDT1-like protein a, chloroplastic n=1 Tax=Sesamum angolense TaxID=2727404 RepID=A0AAE1X8K8_9LAMI|nr:CDT1-like protein a, chloroplastic [Sesamum angolense]